MIFFNGHYPIQKRSTTKAKNKSNRRNKNQRNATRVYNLLKSHNEFSFHDDYENSKRKNTIGFIHITKTGGTNLKDKNVNEFVHYGTYHYETASYYKDVSMKCFAIFRDPIERYISLYYYNTRGSNKYTHMLRHNVKSKNINEFIEEHYNDQTFVDKFEHGIQFRPQSSWLINGDKDYTHIVLFDKVNLIKNIKHFFKSIYGKEYIYNESSLPVNVTNYDKVEPDSSELSELSLQRLLEMYSQDFEIFYNIKQSGKTHINLINLNRISPVIETR